MFASHEPSNPVYGNVAYTPETCYMNDKSKSEDGLLDLSCADPRTIKSINEALARIAAEPGSYTMPIVVPYYKEENATVVPLPSAAPGRGISALVVYGSGRTERFDQLTTLPNGGAVAVVSGSVREIVAYDRPSATLIVPNVPQTVDGALCRIATERGAYFSPIMVRQNHNDDTDNVSVIPLPNIAPGKGIAALVVYSNGETQRYEQITLTTSGDCVALLSGRLTVLCP